MGAKYLMSEFLDSKDQAIVSLLQKDGRMSVQNMAKALGIKLARYVTSIDDHNTQNYHQIDNNNNNNNGNEDISNNRC